jgi:hypothetical protein
MWLPSPGPRTARPRSDIAGRDSSGRILGAIGYSLTVTGQSRAATRRSTCCGSSGRPLRPSGQVEQVPGRPVVDLPVGVHAAVAVGQAAHPDGDPAHLAVVAQGVADGDLERLAAARAAGLVAVLLVRRCRRCPAGRARPRRPRTAGPRTRPRRPPTTGTPCRRRCRRPTVRPGPPRNRRHGRTAGTRRAPRSAMLSGDRPEAGADLGDEQLRLLERGEVPAQRRFAPVPDVGEPPGGPPP